MLEFTIKHQSTGFIYIVEDIHDYYELTDMFYAEHDLNKEDWEQDIQITPSGPLNEIENFEFARRNGCSLEQWFEEVECLELEDMAKLYWLKAECGYDLQTALSKLDDTTVYRNTLKEAAEVIFDDNNLYRIPEDLQSYIDYDKYAHELQIGGILREFEFANQKWTAYN